MRVKTMLAALLVLSAAACGPAPRADEPENVVPTAPAYTGPPPEAPPELLREEAGTLVVTVTDEDGHPLEGVPLALTPIDSPTNLEFASAPSTAADGTFTVAGLLGTFAIATAAVHAENDTAEAEFEAGETTRVDLVLSD